MNINRQLVIRPHEKGWIVVLVGSSDNKVVTEETIPGPKVERVIFKTCRIAADRALWIASYFFNEDGSPVQVVDLSGGERQVLTRNEIPYDLG